VWAQVKHWVLGPIAGAQLLSRIRRDGGMAFPSDPPLSHGSGADPDRVLLIGGMVVGGAGVASHDLALGGRLARRLATRTGRGADVETRSTSRYDTAAAAAMLRAENLERYDVVLIVLGVRELLLPRPVRVWRRDLRVLFGAIAESVPASLPVLLVGVASFARDVDVPRYVVDWLDDTVETFNAETRRLCEETGLAEFVPFDPERIAIGTGRDASLVYESWAVALAPALDRVLALAQPAHRLDDVPHDEERLRAIAGLGVLEGEPDPRLDQIVQMARGMLGMSAALTILDDQNVHVLAASGVRSDAVVPREDTFSELAIGSSGALVVPDAQADPQYRHVIQNPGRDPVRFFAGYPLEAPGGERIGTLCVVDQVPHEFSAEETSLLRDLALRAQAVLWETVGAR
jgi:lysophospholipase L1-like esterase